MSAKDKLKEEIIRLDTSFKCGKRIVGTDYLRDVLRLVVQALEEK